MAVALITLLGLIGGGLAAGYAIAAGSFFLLTIIYFVAGSSLGGIVALCVIIFKYAAADDFLDRSLGGPLDRPRAHGNVKPNLKLDAASDPF